MKKKISIEQLEELAYEWWQRLDEGQVMDYIIDVYIENEGINKSEIK